MSKRNLPVVEVILGSFWQTSCIPGVIEHNNSHSLSVNIAATIKISQHSRRIIV